MEHHLVNFQLPVGKTFVSEHVCGQYPKGQVFSSQKHRKMFSFYMNRVFVAVFQLKMNRQPGDRYSLSGFGSREGPGDRAGVKC